METFETLKAKFEIIKGRMAEGRRFGEICDDADVFLGADDAEFVYSKFVIGMNIDLEAFRKTRK